MLIHRHVARCCARKKKPGELKVLGISIGREINGMHASHFHSTLGRCVGHDEQRSRRKSHFSLTPVTREHPKMANGNIHCPERLRITNFVVRYNDARYLHPRSFLFPLIETKFLSPSVFLSLSLSLFHTFFVLLIFLAFFIQF